MRIPFLSRRTEVRNAPYTDAIIAQILATAQSSKGKANVQTTAALEIAAGVVSRAFASATITGASIPARQLANMARALVTQGQAVAYLNGGTLIDAINPEITGGPQRSSWQYMMEFNSPGGKLTFRKAGHDKVVHWQYSYDLNAPWIGVGPLQRAIESGQLAANIEKSLREETGGVVGYLLPIPTDANDETIASLKGDLKNLAGKTSVVETTAGGWGEGRFAAPKSDYVPQRIGPNPPQSLSLIHSSIQGAVLAACGVPVELVQPADAGGQREAWRRFLHGTIGPLSIILADELSRVFNRDVSLQFESLFASDIAGRARAFGSLVQGGIPIEKAASLSGLLAHD